MIVERPRFVRGFFLLAVSHDEHHATVKESLGFSDAIFR